MKAIVFPGQGSQFVGMGHDLYASFSEAKEVFEEVFHAFPIARLFRLKDLEPL